MKKLANLFHRLSRKAEAGPDLFETRLRTLGKPQPSKRPTRSPRPILFRRTALQ